MSDDAAGWEERYRRGDTPWDLGGPPPALLGFLDTLGPERLRVLVPGAGPGHDAIAFAAAGHEVTAVDVAPTAVAAARARARAVGVALEVVAADLLRLPVGFEAAFDLAWEQTCFCALPPESRPAYVDAVARALRPGGRLVGLFWDHGRPGGPPWAISEGTARAAFRRRFVEVSLEPVPLSAPGRAREFLAVYRRA